MELNEIREENSIQEISDKTKILPEDVDALFAKDFEHLTRIKAFGFISILEREYKTKLKSFKKEASEYYDALGEDLENVTITRSALEGKKGRSVWFYTIVVFLFIYVTWYFLTQFDDNFLSEYIPFMEKNVSVSIDNETLSR